MDPIAIGRRENVELFHNAADEGCASITVNGRVDLSLTFAQISRVSPLGPLPREGQAAQRAGPHGLHRTTGGGSPQRTTSRARRIPMSCLLCTWPEPSLSSLPTSR